jgi:hypothetical protein
MSKSDIGIANLSQNARGAAGVDESNHQGLSAGAGVGWAFPLNDETRILVGPKATLRSLWGGSTFTGAFTLGLLW